MRSRARVRGWPKRSGPAEPGFTCRTPSRSWLSSSMGVAGHDHPRLRARCAVVAARLSRLLLAGKGISQPPGYVAHQDADAAQLHLGLHR